MNMQLSFPNINKDPFSLSVVKMLEEAIINLEIKPGDRLIETKISKTFGVSRGPVREAIIELESLGLVERTPYKGAVVSTLTQKDIQELKSCRMSVEKLAAQIIIDSEEGKNIALKELNTILSEMVKHAYKRELREFLALDFMFHDQLIHGAKNSLLEEMWKPISTRLRRYFYLNSGQGYIPLEEAVKQHSAIVEAISAGDTELTWKILQTHKCWS